MAAQYDALGNYLGDWETEEERRKREEELANTAVRTQEVKTYGDGTVERRTTETMPAVQVAQAVPARVAQPVVQPVSPDTYQRMIQAESGGRNYDAQGRPLTSSAGAMFAGQVMPSTAAQPGFGIRPAQSQTPEEYNRVGRELYQALLQQFNGDEQKAAAAYNAGYGRVQQNLQANQGQLNVGQLPRETQGYLGKVFQGAGRIIEGMIPSAQAGTLPQRPVAPQAVPAAPAAPALQTRPAVNTETGETYQQLVEPQPARAGETAPVAPAGAQPVSPYALSTGTGEPGLRVPGLQPTAVAQPSTAYIDQYQRDQDNPMALLQLRQDDKAPAFIRERAGERAYELMNQEVEKKKGEAQAKELITGAITGDRKAANTIAKELQSGEGSWLKMLLLGFISPTLAGEEAIKLGFGNKWVTSTDQNGNQALIQVNAKGLPLKGYKADGSEIASDDLVAFTTGGTKVTTSGTFFQTPQGQILRAQSDEQGRTRLVDAASGARYTGPTTGLTKLEEAGAIRKMDRGLVIDLAKKHGQNVLDAEKEYVSINGPFKTPEERQQFREAYGYGLAQPGAVPGVAPFPGQPAGQPAAAVRPPAAAPGAATAPAGPVAPAQVPSAVQPPAPGAAVTPVSPAAVPSAVTQPIAGMQTGVAIDKKRQEEFVRYSAEDITPKADAGSQISRIRREQIKGPDGILNNPELAGLLQGAGGAGAEVGNILRDLITGNFKDQADLTQRVAALNLTPRQKDVLYRQIGLNLQVAPLTLKQNAGAGAVSDAEQKANREANVDITRQPLYSGLSLLTRDQFAKDLQAYRADFKTMRPDLKTTDDFNRAWTAEKARLEKQYDGVYAARAAYIARYNKDGNNPGAVVDAFKHYPVPEWNAQSRQWDFGTDFARKASRPRLDEFVR